MTTKTIPTTEQIADAVVYLMRERKRFRSVIKWMQTREKTERDAAKPKRKRKQTLYARNGKKIELWQETVKQLEVK